MNIVTSWMEKGLEQGLEQGEQRGLEHGRSREIAFAVKILKGKLGSLSLEAEQAISTLSFDQLDALGDALPGFGSAADLAAWLQTVER